MPLEVSKRARRSGAFFTALAWADSSHFHLDMMHLVDVSPGGGDTPPPPPRSLPIPLRPGVLCGGARAPALHPWSSAAGDEPPPYIPGPLRRGTSPRPTSLVLCGGGRGPPPQPWPSSR